jgi:hypothetical protein
MNPELVVFFRYVKACHRLTTGLPCRNFTNEELLDDFCAMNQEKNLSFDEFKFNLSAFEVQEKELTPEEIEAINAKTEAELKAKGLIK